VAIIIQPYKLTNHDSLTTKSPKTFKQKATTPVFLSISYIWYSLAVIHYITSSPSSSLYHQSYSFINKPVQVMVHRCLNGRAPQYFDVHCVPLQPETSPFRWSKSIARIWK